MVQYFFVYLLTINLIGAGLAVLDKWKAQHGRWRIPEKRFFWRAHSAGALGFILPCGFAAIKHCINALCGESQQSLFCNCLWQQQSII